MKEGMTSILGNQDREILDQFCRIEGNPTMGFVRNSLDFSQIIWLKSLPPTASIKERIFLCHGTPNNDSTYLLEEVTPEGIADRSPVMVERELDGVAEPVVLCGHSHRFGVLHLAGGHLVVNAGSVGLPAYRDEEPFPHAVENGSPQAVYALLSEQDGRVKAEKVCVDYDWDAAAACAAKRGRDDWARWIKTGIV
jgi:predicted phosphodiesterase